MIPVGELTMLENTARVEIHLVPLRTFRNLTVLTMSLRNFKNFEDRATTDFFEKLIEKHVPKDN